jgi:hypothetical protein
MQLDLGLIVAFPIVLEVIGQNPRDQPRPVFQLHNFGNLEQNAVVVTQGNDVVRALITPYLAVAVGEADSFLIFGGKSSGNLTRTACSTK